MGDEFSNLSTTILLQRWHAGDRAALDSLIVKHQAWILESVRRRMSRSLRVKMESGDVVQIALFKFFNHGPKLLLQNESHFRGLMVRIIRNVLADEADFWSTERRNMACEYQGDPEPVLHLDGPASGDQPDLVLQRNEDRARLRLALELMPPIDRQVFVLRSRGVSYAEISAQLNLSVAALESRFRRAGIQCAALVRRIKARDVEGLFRDLDEQDALDSPGGDGEGGGKEV